jgi:hypothetical protein
VGEPPSIASAKSYEVLASLRKGIFRSGLATEAHNGKGKERNEFIADRILSSVVIDFLRGSHGSGEIESNGRHARC